MRSLRDIAWRCNHAYARLLDRRRGVLAVAAEIVLCSMIGAGLSIASIEPAQKLDIADVPALPCPQQTWPFLSHGCLQADQGAAGAPSRQVRQISVDRDSPRTLYVYPDAPKPGPAKAKRSSGQTTKADRPAQRRPAKRTAPQQRPPADSGYHAYGYRPR